MQYNKTSVSEQEKFILLKIRMLPPDKIAEVADFVDFISQKISDQKLVQAAGEMAEKSFKEVWDNTEDDVYDQL
ncbi:MAG: toxin-antitoxin system, antitoxin component, Xre family protein [Proteobacteria bacterium]|nr:toxin-antitoxin system, antitoxin component, Xre family protein [Pseudomonadota bacterium]